MSSRDGQSFEITPQVLLKAYACGIFPMAESADDPQLYWIEPQARGVLPLDQLQIPRKLAKTIRQAHIEVRVDTDFDGVIDGCATPRVNRETTWINEPIRNLYRELYDQGHCHTIEAWCGDDLVGGLYGVAIGGAFFGESMFSTMADASKISLVYLCARLIRGGFTLLDTQFVTAHLRQFGTIEVDKPRFHQLLEPALDITTANFWALDRHATPTEVLDTIRLHRAETG
jgi:leucyl/phenylalanyl-tRNA---protein transferase